MFAGEAGMSHNNINNRINFNIKKSYIILILQIIRNEIQMGLQRKTDSTSVNGTGHCPQSSYGASECDINDIASHPFIDIV